MEFLSGQAGPGNVYHCKDGDQCQMICVHKTSQYFAQK